MLEFRTSLEQCRPVGQGGNVEHLLGRNILGKGQFIYLFSYFYVFDHLKAI
jgi:hypothetical protein